MLQRAASNAYSWWWASHIRTKQSKWLEQNLQDMEEKVQIVLKMIEEDGDSFARRAEMYYKKRPELISFVEESYRAYRALAERYDKLSTELQNANNTIATVFPEQVQFSMDDEDDDGPPRVPKNFPQFTENNVPQVPQNFPNRDLKGLLTSTSKKLQAKKIQWGSNAANKTLPKSGLTESEALEEIDKLQKEILAQQTVKEFVKSSYEGGIAQYWEIENHIMEMQDRVFNLEEEFNIGKVIEDDEARTLMAEAALKSCEGTLAQLEERQEKSTVEARKEGKRVEDAREKINSLKSKFLPGEVEEENVNQNKEEEAVQKPETVQEKTVEEEAKEPSKDSITVTELAEKIDDLVSKVIGLEAAVSSQTALIDRLRTETDDLQAQIRTLEDDKASLIKDKHVLSQSLKEMQEKLNGCQNLNQNVETQNIRIRTHFIEARCSLDHLCGRLHNVRPYDESEYTGPEEEESSPGIMTPEHFGRQEVSSSPSYPAVNSRRDDENGKIVPAIVKNNERGDEKVYGRESNSDKPDDLILPEKVEDLDVSRRPLANGKQQDEVTEEDDEPSWQEMLLNGLEDREEILLDEYNAVLRNYKDVKKQLADVEKKNRDSHFETSVQLRELRSAIARKDREIQILRRKLNLLQGNRDSKENNSLDSTPLEDQDIQVESNEELKVNRDLEDPMGEREVKAEAEADTDTEDVKSISIDEPPPVSLIEERLRMNIDALLDENLDFWLRFGSSFHQIQKFQTRFDDLKGEIAKLRRKANKDGNGKKDIRSEVRPIYKHLREIQTELTVWIGRSALLKDELHRRFSSLCSIQEDIMKALKEGAEEEEMKFTSHEAAKFQGEILNMKQENNKVRNELQSGLDHVTTLRKEIETTLEQINDEFGLSKNSRTRIPLRSFLFEAKPKKKSSIFSFIHHRKYHQSRSSELPM